MMWEKIKRGWLGFGEFIGTIVGNVILAIFYFTLFAIPALVFTVIIDKIGKNKQGNSYYENEVSDLNLKNIEDALEM